MNSKSPTAKETSAFRALAIYWILFAVCLPLNLKAGGEVHLGMTVDNEQVMQSRNTEEFINAIHQTLQIKGESTLDYDVTVYPKMVSSQGEGMPEQETIFDIIMNLEKGSPLDGLISDVKFHSSMGLSEKDAWKYSHREVVSLLVNGMNTTGTFSNVDGRSWLKVTDILDGNQAVEADGNRMVLELGFGLVYRDGASKFGSATAPEGVNETRESIKFVVEPKEAPLDDAVADEGKTESETVPAPSSSADDPISGTYGLGYSGLLVELKDGGYVLSNPQVQEPEYFPMTPLEDGSYSVSYNGTPFILRFPLNVKGVAMSVVMQRDEFETTLPRK